MIENDPGRSERPFSHRVPPLRDPNAFMEGAEARRAGDRSFLDLTPTNPTRVGFTFGRAPGGAWSDVYDPDPRGLGTAREAIAEYYRASGLEADPGDIVLTASTSEAYAFLFKLLADPGHEILVPAPSYPLFEHLTTLEGVLPRAYALRYSKQRWNVDFDSMRDHLGPSTRAIVLVHPNNPTGSFLSPAEIEQMGALAAEHEVPLIADEVFFDYPRPDLEFTPLRVASSNQHLTFSLGGLSKACALPQAKLGWIKVSGPRDVRQNALDRLAFIADAYLSVGSAVQAAAPRALARRLSIQAEIQERLARNASTLEDVLRSVSGLRPLPREGGWYAVLELPRSWNDEAFAAALLKEGVLVHPGYFYDFEEENLVVTSLLTSEATWLQGIRRLAARAALPA